MTQPPRLFVRRAIVTASFASLVLSSPAIAQTGERVMEPHRTPKRLVYPIVGAAISGAASALYFISGPNSLAGTCSGAPCVAAFSMGAGAFIGWLVGKEKDDLHALRYKGGMPLFPKSVRVDLSGDPRRVVAFDSLIAASGNGGVQIVKNGAKPQVLAKRAEALRGVSDAVLVPGSGELALTAAGGFYRFPLLSGQGVQLRGAPAAAVALLGTDYVIGSGVRVERVKRTATESGTWPGITLPDSVRSFKIDTRGIVWTLTSSELYALRPAADSFAIEGRLPLPRGAQRVDVEGNLAAVALGDSGLRFVDVTDVTQPKRIADWRGTPFTYDVALAGGKAYIAAGIDGMARVSLKNGTTTLMEGLARELGFIVAITSDGKYLWVIEGNSTPVSVKRVEMNF